MSLWATLRGKPPPLPRVCKTLLMEVFAGAFLVSTVATQFGHVMSQPTDMEHDGANLTMKSCRDELDGRSRGTTQFALWFEFPCQPWGSSSGLNISRGGETAERIWAARWSYLDMLRWMSKKVRERLNEGRVVILENPLTSRVYKLKDLEDLFGVCDSFDGEEFEMVRGDQCMFGQKDKESDLPYQAPTGWATNSKWVKDALGI